MSHRMLHIRKGSAAALQKFTASQRKCWAEFRAQSYWDWIRLLLLTSLCALLLISDDFLQQIYTDNNQAEIELVFVIVVWAVSACLWLSGRRWFVNCIIGYFAVLQLMQLSHISFTGMPLAPYDIGKMFSERMEIGIAIRSSLQDHWPVLLAWGLPYLALFVIYNRGLPRYRVTLRWPSWVAMVLILATLGSKFHRATERDMIAFLPGPTRSSLHNSINSFSYYWVRLLGRQDTFTRPAYKDYEVVAAPFVDAPEHIWIILTDSLRYDRLGLFGYERDTTPQLSAMYESGIVSKKKGIAASVATLASLPLFINVVQEPGNLRALEEGWGNLYRHAQAAGYRTFWLSSQESKVMHGISTNHVDVRISREDHMLSFSAKDDFALLDILEKQDFGEKSFVIINLRTVHSPYEENYDSAGDRYRKWPDGPEIESETRKNNQYDNAVYALDALLAESIQSMARLTKGDRLWLMTSDHGQMLGETGRWGHNRLTPEVAAIPVVLSQIRDLESDLPYRLPDKDHLSHYELGKFILQKLNLHLFNPNEIAHRHYFQSDQIYEDNLFRVILETPNGLQMLEKQQVGQYQPSP